MLSQTLLSQIRVVKNIRRVGSTTGWRSLYMHGLWELQDLKEFRMAGSFFRVDHEVHWLPYYFNNRERVICSVK